MQIIEQTWDGIEFESQDAAYSGKAFAWDFLNKAHCRFDLKGNHYKYAIKPRVHILPLRILQETEGIGKKGLYIGCSLPLGVLILREEGYDVSGIDKDGQAMKFGIEEGLDCKCGDATKLSEHFEAGSLDFTLSRNLKRRDYISEEDIKAILTQEFMVLKEGGVSISSCMVVPYFLREKLEDLYRQTPFGDNITRYMIYMTKYGVSSKQPKGVVDVLRKI